MSFRSSNAYFETITCCFFICGGFVSFGGVEGVKREKRQPLRKNCITETTPSSSQSETPRQQILHPRHSVLNEELISGFILKGGNKKMGQGLKKKEGKKKQLFQFKYWPILWFKVSYSCFSLVMCSWGDFCENWYIIINNLSSSVRKHPSLIHTSSDLPVALSVGDNFHILGLQAAQRLHWCCV